MIAMDEVDERRVDVDGVEELLERSLVAAHERDLRRHALARVDLSAHPLLFDALPLRIGKTLEKGIDCVDRSHRSVEVDDEEGLSSAFRDARSDRRRATWRAHVSEWTIMGRILRVIPR